MRILLLSDLGQPGQKALLNQTAPGDLHADIVVAGLPWNSGPFTDALLLDAIQPKVIVIADSEYPATKRASPVLRQRLQQRNVPVIYASESGPVTFVLREAGFDLKTAGGDMISFGALSNGWQRAGSAE